MYFQLMPHVGLLQIIHNNRLLFPSSLSTVVILPAADSFGDYVTFGVLWIFQNVYTNARTVRGRVGCCLFVGWLLLVTVGLGLLSCHSQ